MNSWDSSAIAELEHFYNCELTLYVESLPVLQLAFVHGKANLRFYYIKSWCLKKDM